jgi:hypothetical protein
MHCTTELHNVLERGLKLKGKTTANIPLNSGLVSTCLDFEFDETTNHKLFSEILTLLVK